MVDRQLNIQVRLATAGIKRDAEALKREIAAIKLPEVQVGLGLGKSGNEAAKVAREQAFAQREYALATQEAAKSSQQLLREQKFLEAVRLDVAFQGVIKAAPSLTNTAFAFNQIVAAAQTAIGVLQPFYNLLIGSNEQLNQQLLQAQTTLAATTEISRDGVALTGVEAIKATREQLQQAIKQVEIDTQNLAGVTSQQVNEIYSIAISRAGDLVGQSKQLADPIQAANKITQGFAATLGTLQLPLEQARSELLAILEGQVNADSTIGKTLGLTPKLIADFKEQGILVDELVKRFQPFVEGNALAAKSIGTVSSNLVDLVQRLGRDLGEPLFDPLVNSLADLEGFLKANEGQIKNLGTEGIATLTGLVSNVADAGQRVSDVVTPILQEIGPAAGDAAKQVATGLGLTAEAAATTVENLKPILTLVGNITKEALNLITTSQTGIGLLTGGYGRSTEAVEAYGRATANASDQAIALTNKLRQASEEREASAKSGIKLTAEQEAAEKRLRTQALSQIEALKAQREELKAARNVAIGPENKSNLTGQISEIDRAISGLEKYATANDQATGKVTIRKKETEDATKILKNEEIALAKSAAAVQDIENEKLLAIRQRQLNTRADEEQVAIEIAGIKAQSAQQEVEIAQAALDQIQSQRERGLLKADEAAKKEIDAASKVKAARVKAVEAELAALEQVRKKRIADAEEESARLEAIAKLTATRQANAAKSALLETGATGGDSVAAEREFQKQQQALNEQAAEREKTLLEGRLQRVRQFKSEGVLSAKDAAKQERALIQQLADAEGKVLDVRLTRQRQAREEQIRAIEETAARAKAAIDLESSGIEQMIAGRERLTKAIANQQALIEAQANVGKAFSDASVAQSEIQLKTVERAVDLASRLKDQTLTEGEVKALQAALTDTGFRADSDQADFLVKQIQLEDELARKKAESLQQELLLERQLAEIKAKSSSIDSQNAIAQAELNQLKAEQVKLDAESALKKAEASGDQNQIELAQQQLKIADRGIELAAKQLEGERESARSKQQVLELEKQAIGIRQQSQLGQAADAERERELAQTIGLIDARKGATDPALQARIAGIQNQASGALGVLQTPQSPQQLLQMNGGPPPTVAQQLAVTPPAVTDAVVSELKKQTDLLSRLVQNSDIPSIGQLVVSSPQPVQDAGRITNSILKQRYASSGEG